MEYAHIMTCVTLHRFKDNSIANDAKHFMQDSSSIQDVAVAKARVQCTDAEQRFKHVNRVQMMHKIGHNANASYVMVVQEVSDGCVIATTKN